MLTYTVEPLTAALIQETVPMQAAYWREVAGPFHAFPPDVDWLTYGNAQARGMLRVICGRDATGTLRAGAFVLTAPHPHYACLAASLPLLFLDPDFRQGREGVRLLREVERVAGEAGAQLLMTHGGVHNHVARLFEYLQYADFGRYFVKVLPDGPHGLTPVFKGRE